MILGECTFIIKTVLGLTQGSFFSFLSHAQVRFAHGLRWGGACAGHLLRRFSGDVRLAGGKAGVCCG